MRGIGRYSKVEVVEAAVFVGVVVVGNGLVFRWEGNRQLKASQCCGVSGGLLSAMPLECTVFPNYISFDNTQRASFIVSTGHQCQ